jgi:hypothetical protein
VSGETADADSVTPDKTKKAPAKKSKKAPAEPEKPRGERPAGTRERKQTKPYVPEFFSPKTKATGKRKK